MRIVKGLCVEHPQEYCGQDEGKPFTCPRCITSRNVDNVEAIKLFQRALSDELGRARETQMKALNALSVVLAARAALFSEIAHGDTEHRAWLAKTIDSVFANGDSMALPLLKETAP